MSCNPNGERWFTELDHGRPFAFRTQPTLISGFSNNLAELHQGDLPSLKSLCSKALGRHWSIGMGWDNISQLLLISNPRLRTHKVLDWAKCWGKPA